MLGNIVKIRIKKTCSRTITFTVHPCLRFEIKLHSIWLKKQICRHIKWPEQYILVFVLMMKTFQISKAQLSIPYVYIRLTVHHFFETIECDQPRWENFTRMYFWWSNRIWLHQSSKPEPDLRSNGSPFVILGYIFMRLCVLHGTLRCRLMFDSEESPHLDQDCFLRDIHCVGNVLKMYFR